MKKKKAYNKCPDCGTKTQECIFKWFKDDCYCPKCEKCFASAKTDSPTGRFIIANSK